MKDDIFARLVCWKLEISYYRVIIISWRILDFFYRIFLKIIYIYIIFFAWVKYLNFHNSSSSFASRYLFKKCKLWHGHSVKHPLLIKQTNWWCGSDDGYLFRSTVWYCPVWGGGGGGGWGSAQSKRTACKGKCPVKKDSMQGKVPSHKGQNGNCYDHYVSFDKGELGYMLNEY